MSKEVQELLKAFKLMQNYCKNHHNCTTCKYNKFCDVVVFNKTRSIPNWDLPPLEEKEEV